MKPMRSAFIAMSLLALAGCSGGGGGGGLVSRALNPDSPLLTATGGEAHAPVPLNPSYRVKSIDVTVPPELTSSEQNSIKPRVDILWHEDPQGNRHAQVDEIMTDALTKGVAGMNGARDVTLEVVMTRFHALTKRTRYSIGGEHEIWMIMSVRDAKSGELLEPPRMIGFDERISPEQALANEAIGLNQRSEIIALVKQLIQFELGRPRDFLQG